MRKKDQPKIEVLEKGNGEGDRPEENDASTEPKAPEKIRRRYPHGQPFPVQFTVMQWQPWAERHGGMGGLEFELRYPKALQLRGVLSDLWKAGEGLRAYRDEDGADAVLTVVAPWPKGVVTDPAQLFAVMLEASEPGVYPVRTTKARLYTALGQSLPALHLEPFEAEVVTNGADADPVPDPVRTAAVLP